jgi:hypothetical protein
VEKIEFIQVLMISVDHQQLCIQGGKHGEEWFETRKYCASIGAVPADWATRRDGDRGHRYQGEASAARTEAG